MVLTGVHDEEIQLDASGDDLEEGARALLKVVLANWKGLLRPWSVAGDKAYSLGQQRKKKVRVERSRMACARA